MSQVRLVPVSPDDADLRLDRWFARHYPGLGHGRLQKLLRTGQVRLDGSRAKAGARVRPGQTIRVPPLPDAAQSDPGRPAAEAGPAPGDVDRADHAALRDRVLYRDDDILVLDKPPGLAVQGGTGQRRHVDGLAAALQFDAARPPKLVHRLDKETAGVLLLGRTAAAAAWLTRQFRENRVTKLYWAVTVGRPPFDHGEVALALTKARTPAGDRVVADPAAGRQALSRYRVVAAAGELTWLALEPATGRTHQLRVHAAALGCPILGDRKYGARTQKGGLHLLARAVTLAPGPGRPALTVTAPLPKHMKETFRQAGWHDPA